MVYLQIKFFGGKKLGCKSAVWRGYLLLFKILNILTQLEHVILTMSDAI